MPRLSAILLSFNRAQYLARTIESVVHQTEPDFDLTIYDDASSDGAYDIASHYARLDSRIRVVRNPINLGMPGNLNKALADKAGSDLVAVLHDGDIYHSEAFGSWCKALEQCSNAGFVFNQYRFIGRTGEEIHALYVDDACMDGRRFLVDEIMNRPRRDSPIWGTVAVRGRCLREVGALNPVLGAWADVDLWHRLALSYDVAYVAAPLVEVPTRDVLPSNWSSGWNEYVALTRIYLASAGRLGRPRMFVNQLGYAGIELARLPRRIGSRYMRKSTESRGRSGSQSWR